MCFLFKHNHTWQQTLAWAWGEQIIFHWRSVCRTRRPIYAVKICRITVFIPPSTFKIWCTIRGTCISVVVKCRRLHHVHVVVGDFHHCNIVYVGNKYSIFVKFRVRSHFSSPSDRGNLIFSRVAPGSCFFRPLFALFNWLPPFY